MLSIANSRHTLIVQFVFIAANAVGVVLATVYHASTPDLYPNNAHHKIGWIVTWVVSAHVLVNLAGRVVNTWSNNNLRAGYQCLHPFLPGQDSTPAAQDSYHSHTSDDSGHGTASHSLPVRSGIVPAMCAGSGGVQSENSKEYSGDNDEFEDLPLSSADSPRATLVAKITQIVSHDIWKYVEFGYRIVDRVLLLFGFIALTTGIITFARFFVSLLLALNLFAGLFLTLFCFFN